ncbi:MAG: type II toxin-antitoxin system VapC family toxin [Proteobacteria bacterium]|nr:type II toxin-antitoxin system VapC family toxin [Pseudomonadota bacterium]
MKWMLDTDTCIALINRQPRDLIKRLQTKAVGDVGISSITLAELRHGVAKSTRRDQNRAALDRFLLPLDIAAFDDLAADLYGTVRADLETAGMPIGPLDTLIASHAVSLNVVLVTHNVAEFRRVTGLRLEDWLK